MKKRIISFILCVVMCCAIFPASAFAAGPEPKHEENLTPALVAAFGTQVMSVSSGGYTGGDYCKNLRLCFTTGYNPGDGTSQRLVSGKQVEDIVLIAKSQRGYHEGSDANDLKGSSTGSGNYTEYGRFYGYNGVAWGGYFIYWLGRMVKCSQNLFTLATKAYNSSDVRVGDIVIMRNGENRGIVSRISGNTIWIIEGNYSDRVTETPYSITSSSITGYAHPAYGNWDKQLYADYK